MNGVSKLPYIILASASPRRKELLAACGVEYTVQISDVDEAVIEGESPEDMVRRLSLLKAQSVATSFMHNLVLGADTTVVVDGEIFGKPINRADAKRMLTILQGRKHTVVGGIALICRDQNFEHVEVHSTEVEMVSLSEEQIDQYIHTGEPMDKAGSYAIQGIGSSIVKSVNGSYTNVVGLNVAAVVAMLQKFQSR